MPRPARTRLATSRALLALASMAGGGGLLGACGVLAGIEEFHFLQPDASDVVAPTVDGSGDGNVERDGAVLVPEGGQDAAFVFDGSVQADSSPPQDANVEDANLGVDTGVDASGCSQCTSSEVCVLDACYTLVADSRSDPRSILVSGSLVAWAEYGQGLSGAGNVYGCASVPCGAGEPMTILGSVTRPTLRRASTGGMNTLFQAQSASLTPIYSVQSSGALTTLVPSADKVFGAAATTSAAAWGTNDSIQMCLLGSCNSSTLLLTKPGGIPVTGAAMARINNRVYWTPPNKGVFSCEALNCTSPIGFGSALNGTVVDFDVDGAGLVAATASTATSYDLAGTAGPAFAVSGTTISAMVMDAANVYLATAAGIYRVDRTTMTGGLLYSAPAFGIALSGSFLYWTAATGRILRAPQ